MNLPLKIALGIIIAIGFCTAAGWLIAGGLLYGTTRAVAQIVAEHATKLPAVQTRYQPTTTTEQTSDAVVQKTSVNRLSDCEVINAKGEHFTCTPHHGH